MSRILNHRSHITARTYIRTASTKIQGPSAVSGGNEGGFKIWRNLALFVALPATALAALNCFFQHKEHQVSDQQLVKYDYKCIRTKRFPWKDGNRSLFHNPDINALPEDYE